jgi:hypothetical protein
MQTRPEESLTKIRNHLKTLKLPGIQKVLEQESSEALTQGLPPTELLERLFAIEANALTERRIENVDFKELGDPVVTTAIVDPHGAPFHHHHYSGAQLEDARIKEAQQPGKETKAKSVIAVRRRLLWGPQPLLFHWRYDPQQTRQ